MKRATHVLAAAAAMAAVAAGFAGDPVPLSDISALRVAEWLRERRDVHIYDVRDSTAFHAFAIPAAEHVTLATLAALPLTRADTVIVYGTRDDAAAARARARIRARGIAASYVLRGGIEEWVSDVLNPRLAPDAAPEDTAAFERVAELSRYFGGVPRRAPADVSPHAAPAGDAARQMEAVLRRGC